MIQFKHNLTKELNMPLILLKKGKEKAATLTGLQELKKSLESIGDIPPYNDRKVFDYAVNFFNAIISFQDNFVLDAKNFKAVTDEIASIKIHIKNAGRHEFGWVRAKPGEPVTLDNLYLGNVYGIWTKTAREFQNSDVEFGDRSILKNPESKVKVRELIANEQLIPFIKSHRKP
ncbi:MAG: hypothetical protein LBF37_03935 [Rickettsiales bacterium]|jgi:hypothetical protein|nr:hypothetical protein [Rickettsiales bacterium]